MSKKVKKLTKSITKVAKSVVGLDLAKGVLGDITGANAAEAAAKRQEAEQARIAQAQQNLERNLAVDLTNQSSAEVIAGGSAAESADDRRKRRRGSGALSSTLGII
jgi:hypothetical protein